MERDDKCYYCDKLAVAERTIVVDVEADCDVDELGKELWYSRPIYSTVGVCSEHMQDDDERIGEE